MTHCEFYKKIAMYDKDAESSPWQQAFITHLPECSECRQSLEQRDKVEHLLLEFERPAPPLAVQYNYYTRLEKLFPVRGRFAIIKDRLSSWYRERERLQPVPFFMLRTISLVSIGIVIGWLLFTGPKVKDISNNPAFTDNGFDTQELKLVNDFLVQSEILLLAIKNNTLNNDDPKDLNVDKSLAQNLLLKMVVVQNMAQTMDNEELVRFINQLEFLFLQISNADDREIIKVFNQLKQLVDESTLIYESENYQTLIKGMI